MLKWALIFFIVAIVAGLAGFGGIAGAAADIAMFLFWAAVILFVVFLILFQQALQRGLLTSFVGAIRNQSAPVLVYSVDGQRVILRRTTIEEVEFREPPGEERPG